MKLRLFPWLVGAFASWVQAGELAPASAQYSQEGTAPTSAPAASSPATPKPAPKLFPRKVWPKVELSDGRVLEKVRVTAEDAGTVTLIHSGGVSKVDKRALPEEMAALHPYDEAGAEADAVRADERRREAAEAAERAEDRRTRRVEEAPEVRRPWNERRISPQPPATSPSAHTTEEIDQAARQKARAYFETEKRTGSGSTLAFRVFLETEPPTEVSGWPNRWAVEGTASYRVYDSYGGGAFSTRSNKKFRATVEAAPGQKIKVVDFEER